jgi:hypothetical protein
MDDDDTEAPLRLLPEMSSDLSQQQPGVISDACTRARRRSTAHLMLGSCSALESRVEAKPLNDTSRRLLAIAHKQTTSMKRSYGVMEQGNVEDATTMRTLA